MAEPQSYKTHRQFDPLYHYVLLPFLLLNFLFMAYHAVTDPDMVDIWAALMGLALVLLALYARTFALRAQNRVIRLEERLRLRELAPADVQKRIPEFTTDQLIGLRFASDAELPELAATVLRDNIQKRDAIKKMVKHWRADVERV